MVVSDAQTESLPPVSVQSNESNVAREEDNMETDETEDTSEKRITRSAVKGKHRQFPSAHKDF